MNELRGLWRGKRIDNKKWVEGHYFYQQKGILEGDVHYIVTYRGWGFSWLRVDPSTLGECTGLRDKNGKLIFEGDIIRYKKHLFCIEWSADICSFTSRALDGANFMPCTNVGTMNNYEVISNIHDNPELLPAHEEDGESNAR